ncbi:MAG TPA: LptF/LptG family permease [Gemmatimonadota bacterium]|nr:LptF/LptG family permease [Gemmatimonadota bacterium]
MGILDRYILRQLVAPFGFSLAALTTLMLLDQVAKTFDLLVGKGLGWQVVAEVFALSIPFLMAVIVPMAVLVTVLYTFTRLASDNEINAMKASGVSLLRITLPAVGAAAVVAVGLYWFNDNVLPESNYQLQSLRRSISQKSPTFALRERSVNEVVDRELFIEAQRVDPKTNLLGDVTIWDATRPEKIRTIIADSGTMEFNQSQTELYLTLYDGEIRESEVDRPDEFQHVWFQTQHMRIPDIGNELDRSTGGTRGDRELPIDSMRVKAAENHARAAEATRTSAVLALSYTDRLLGGLSEDIGPLEAGGGDAAADETGAGDTVEAGGAETTADSDDRADADSADAFATGWRAGQLIGSPAGALNSFRSHAAQRDRYVKSALQFEVEIWKKFSLPAACIVFVLIGVPLAARYHRGGISMVVGVSFLVFTAYYVALIGGESVADQELLSPFWAMWAPNVLFLALGIGAFFHSRRAGG